MNHRILSVRSIATALALAAIVLAAAGLVPAGSAARGEPLLIAAYYPWFDDNTWNANVSTFAPAQPYNSDDAAVIARHVEQARGAGIDAFASAWMSPGDRTDDNFGRILATATGSSFRVAPVIQTPLEGDTLAAIAARIGAFTARHGGHPNLLRHEGRPVLFFVNTDHLPGSWSALRALADPAASQVWIGEGLNFGLLSVFDGMYLLKVMHAGLPNDYIKAPNWARSVRARGADKLWVATVMPGWDDSLAGSGPNPLRAPSQVFTVDRQEGAVYQRTWQSAIGSSPDWIFLNSFNEWVEGTQIEPATAYGATYLDLTRSLRANW